MKIIIAIIALSSICAFGSSLDPEPSPNSSGKTLYINGKFYHDLKMISFKYGVATFDCKEGRVSAVWAYLPSFDRRPFEKEKADFETKGKSDRK